MKKSDNTRPSERRIGARIRIKPAYRSEAEAHFAQAGFAPIYTELRTDGNISYWFDKDQFGLIVEAGVLEQMPLYWWALHATMGGPPANNRSDPGTIAPDGIGRDNGN